MGVVGVLVELLVGVGGGIAYVTYGYAFSVFALALPVLAIVTAVIVNLRHGHNRALRAASMRRTTRRQKVLGSGLPAAMVGVFLLLLYETFSGEYWAALPLYLLIVLFGIWSEVGLMSMRKLARTSQPEQAN
jgi:hypothetical protein